MSQSTVHIMYSIYECRCCLAAGGLSDDRTGSQMAYACFNTIFEVVCQSEDEILLFSSARYGRKRHGRSGQMPGARDEGVRRGRAASTEQGLRGAEEMLDSRQHGFLWRSVRIQGVPDRRLPLYSE